LYPDEIDVVLVFIPQRLLDRSDKIYMGMAGHQTEGFTVTRPRRIGIGVITVVREALV
jgi:hypothetical protein